MNSEQGYEIVIQGLLEMLSLCDHKLVHCRRRFEGWCLGILGYVAVRMLDG